VKLRGGRIYNNWVSNHVDGFNIWANVLDWHNPVGLKSKDVPIIS